METSSFAEYFDRLLDKLGLAAVRGTWQEGTIEGERTRLFTVTWAAGWGKPTVVFIPGTAVYALAYGELLHGLWQQGFNVVSFDPRGQGQSGGARGDYTIAEHVRDARTMCRFARERFGGPVFVMGSSQGGIEAFYLAAGDEPVAGCICHNIADLPSPQSLRLTRLGPSRKVAGWGITRIFARISIAMIVLLSRLFPRLPLPIGLYLDLKKEPMRVFGNAWEFIRQDPLCLRSITLRAFASIASTPLPRPLGAITTPILVLHSTGDNIFPQDYIEDLFHQLTCSKALKIYPNRPHLITIEHVPEILPDVAEWIRSRV
jgi:alpha-beta hydrolase superfamily lysophospholipase